MEIKTHHATLSQAIREGAKLRPQAHGEYFADGRTCAIGAATEALFGHLSLDDDGMFCETENLFPYTGAVPSTGCPSCEARTTFISTITHLNDEHRWTREAIAGWLETEEEKLGFITVVDTQNDARASPLSQEVEQHGAVSAST